MIRLCKDCRWIDGAVCVHPENVDVVTGKLVPQDAHDMRNDKAGGFCGRAAKLFEPNEKFAAAQTEAARAELARGRASFQFVRW